jgi:hypothetical protein
MMVDRGRVAISLVEEDIGRDIAMKIAGQLVMFFRRLGGQLQFSRRGESLPAGRSEPTSPAARSTMPAPRHLAGCERGLVAAALFAVLRNLLLCAAQLKLSRNPGSAHRMTPNSPLSDKVM